MTQWEDGEQESLPLELERQVDALCLEFEKAWREKQTAPRIEDYAQRVPKVARRAAIRELIAQEVDLLREEGEAVDIREYHERFPQNGPEVEAAFALLAHRAPVATKRKAEEEPLPEQIGRYLIQGTLGKGGYGLVYLARDTELDRQVALKAPRADRFPSPEAMERFVQEARTVAQFDHPRIVRVHDVFRESDRVVIVMQYVEGQDLAKRLKVGGPMSPEETAGLIMQVAEAIAFAHQRAFWHRDLKPANILLDTQGRPHVADFGLAIHESDQGGKAGERAGTPPYMSPEQVRGEAHRLDGRCDIWSLGVILYEMLAGRRPFAGANHGELFDEIEHRDPKPPRMFDRELPAEVERICLKCLEKRATDRYTTAADVVDDLRHWQSGDRSPAVGAADAKKVKIVPKGLRSFGPEDADFFLDLLPGPRDRDGLPESIRFWKTRIEEPDAEQTFSVGLIYGPSGCGKSSLVRAGLLPRLASHVTAIPIEATPADTEVRLLKGLRRHFPAIPLDMSLPDVLKSLREGEWMAVDQKVLIVLDQFEQWLHTQRAEEDTQLQRALRQCDGRRVQCLCLVRDDFWAAMSRFLRAVEIELIQGHNMAFVDKFDLLHARRVLAAIGRAHGRLPEGPDDATPDQEAFLDRAIEDLAEDGKVICVRLTLFADLLKAEPWEIATLKQTHGREDLGVRFLEETFGAKSAPAERRFHEKAVRAVLKELLREAGASIRGAIRSYEELLESSGYAPRPKDFDNLIRVLNNELRLITPTDPQQLDPDVAPPNEHDDRTRYFQLSHDYLVPAIRQWLARGQTRRDKAERLLEERADLWNARPETRHLPSAWEWTKIRVLTKSRRWTGTQRKMMAKAGRFHGVRLCTALVFLLAAGVGVQQFVSYQRAEVARVELEHGKEQAETLVKSLLIAPAEAVPWAIRDLEAFQAQAVPILQERFAELKADPKGESRQALHAALALADFAQVEHQFLVSSIATANADECANIVTALQNEKGVALNALREEAAKAERAEQWRARARLAIIALHLGEASIAGDMFKLQEDPIERTVLIDTFPSWHADLAELAKLVSIVQEIDDGAFLSGVCLTVGSVPREELSAEDRIAWKKLFDGWYRSKTDTSTHSATVWAMRSWELEVDEVSSPDRPIDECEWYVNTLGMTMLKIPVGQFTRNSRKVYPDDVITVDAIEQRVTLTRPFSLCDREVSFDQFQQFVDDEVASGATGWYWSGTNRWSRSSDCPVNSVSWFNAVRFCNWLSRKEDLTECYIPTGEKQEIYSLEYDVWELNEEGTGYRLPTEAEWEYASRAGTVTAYAFGEESALDMYAVWRTSQTEPCGGHLPNGWGLFDMHGNVFEWCHDWYDDFSESETQDPLGPKQGVFGDRVIRGGSFDDQRRYLHNSVRDSSRPSHGLNTYGFRVARTHAVEQRRSRNPHPPKAASLRKASAAVPVDEG